MMDDDIRLLKTNGVMTVGMSGDIIAEDLKMVLEELGEITGGQISSQETLNNIFKHFCIGK
jgi:tRNA modification GTPase